MSFENGMSFENAIARLGFKHYVLRARYPVLLLFWSLKFILIVFVFFDMV